MGMRQTVERTADRGEGSRTSLSFGDGVVGYASPETEARMIYDRPVPLQWKLAVQMRIQNPGIPWKQVAKSLGISHQTIYIWTKKPEFQRYEAWCVDQVKIEIPEEMVRAQAAVADRVRSRFETHAEEMQDRLIAILETEDDPKLQASIAQDWLDRAGHSAVRKDNGPRGVALVMTPEVLERLMGRAAEAFDGKTLDVHGQVVE
jgi:transposase